MNALYRWIDRQFIVPTDTDVDRARKRSLLITRTISLIAGLVYGIFFLYHGLYTPAVLSLGYFVVQVVNTAYMLRARRIYGSIIVTVVINIAIGIFGQIALGGFAQSGGVSMLGLVSPMLALLGLGRKVGTRTFFVFLLLELGLVVFDAPIKTSAPVIPPGLSVALLQLNIFVVATVVVTLTAIIASEMDNARARADNLLLNILPGPIAERLKHNPETIADGYGDVTVLFADIVDFTSLSANADPRDVVRMLNDVFSDFDALADKHQLEKIKTIGDAYMVEGGLPVPFANHDEAVLLFALDMLKALEQRRAWNDQPIRVRIGINTGPVVAGVIGKHKFIYDLWGDAVNTASRMESHGLGNTIQVTESTYQRLKDRYEFEARGVVNIKGKGDMNTYLLRGRKAEAAI